MQPTSHEPSRLHSPHSNECTLAKHAQRPRSSEETAAGFRLGVFLLFLCALHCNRTTRTQATTTTPTPSRHIRVGINGIRATNQPCRNYTITYNREDSHPTAAPEQHSDVRWHSTLPRENFLTVSFRERVRFDHVEVHWHFVPTARGACRAKLALEVAGNTVVEVRPSSHCNSVSTASSYEESTVVALPRALETSVLRWIDRTDDAERQQVAEASVIVDRLDLWEGEPPRRPVLIANESVSDGEIGGSGPGGWHWRVPHQGLFLVRPNQQWTPIGGPLAREHGERVVIVSDEERGFFAIGVADEEHAGPSTRHIFYMNPAADEEPQLRTMAPGAISNAWFDRCRQSLVVELRDHSRYALQPDGTLQRL